VLLESYRKEIFRSKCQSTVESLHCFGHLDQDVREVLPYLNAVLGGFEYTENPPSVTFKAHGKLITVHPRKIAINALKDEQEADKILEWLKGEINEAWERRAEIEPSCEGRPKPRIIEVLKHLPKTNCRECNEATCMVFATRVAEGARDPRDCSPLVGENLEALERYMGQFPLG
jgi:ArsR family metal-binding transcriptional regulator